MRLFRADQAVREYVGAAFPDLPHVWREGFGIALEDADGMVRGGAVVTHLTGFDAQVTVFLERPALTQGVLRAFCGFLFDAPPRGLGLARCTFEIHPKNRRSRRLAEGLGARLEGRRRRGLDGRRAALIYGLLPEECRFHEVPETA